MLLDVVFGFYVGVFLKCASRLSLSLCGLVFVVFVCCMRGLNCGVRGGFMWGLLLGIMWVFL